MLTRILLDPAATSGGAADPPSPAVAPAAQATLPLGSPPPATPTPAAPPPASSLSKSAKVEIDAQEYVSTLQTLKDLQTRVGTFEAKAQAELEVERARHLNALAEKEGAGKALEAQREQLRIELENARKLAEQNIRETENRVRSELGQALDREKTTASARHTELATQAEQFKTMAATLENQLLTEKRGRLVAEALAGRQFVSDDAKQQVELLLAQRLDAERDKDNNIVIRDRATGKFAGEVLGGLLDTPQYSHFLSASSRGGAGATAKATGTTATTTPAVTAAATAIDDVNAKAIANLAALTQKREQTAWGLGFHPANDPARSGVGAGSRN